MTINIFFLFKPPCIESILDLNLREICIVLMCQQSSKWEFQANMEHLRPDHSVNIPLLFTGNDVMFRGFIIRKIKDWVFKSCESILKSSKEWLQDLQNIPTCADVENCLNKILREGDKSKCRRKRNSNQAASIAYVCHESSVGELCWKTIHVSFNKIRKVEGSRSDLWTFLQDYFQSFMIGLMINVVKSKCSSDSRSTKRRYSQTSLQKEVNCTGHGMREVDCFLECIWPECVKNYLNEEIQKTEKVIKILQAKFIPNLTTIMKTAEVNDEVIYECQIRLSWYINYYYD